MIMKQLIQSLLYLHKNNIAHRDIKPENFLIKEPDNLETIKLIDFGLSKDFGPEAIMTTPMGSLYYVAPEVFEGQYDAKCDMWSLGVLLYALLSGKVPFNGIDQKHIIQTIRKGEFHFNHSVFS